MFSLVCRSAAIALMLAAGPHIAAAQTAPQSSAKAEVLRSIFANHGYVVDSATTWDWLSPPVTSFRVHDSEARQVLLVNVYSNTAMAADASGHAPNVVYHASTRLGYVTLYESDESSVESVSLSCDPMDQWSGVAANTPNTDVDDRFIDIVLEALTPGAPVRNE